MKKARLGFTIIEVMLFLAITGLLFVGVAIGVQSSIWQQRAQDSVQNYAEFLRSVYSDVANPQSLGDGRSGKVIYGKLIVFGQKRGLNNEALSTGSVFAYNVVGDLLSSPTGSILELLSEAKINILIPEGGSTKMAYVGDVVTYSPRWSAAIENGTRGEYYTGAVLIVRHPASGIITTLATDGNISTNVFNINQKVANGTGNLNNLLVSLLSRFSLREVNFCVNPSGINASGMRYDVRIIENAHNASGIEIIGDDGVC